MCCLACISWFNSALGRIVCVLAMSLFLDFVFAILFLKNLWCYACGQIHRPKFFSYNQLEFKLDKNRRCTKCIDNGIAVKRWKIDDSTDHHDLLLEGGKPVEVKDEEVKAKKSKIPEDANGYYAVLRDGEEEGDGSESDSSEEHHDDSSGDGANTDSSSDGGNSSSEEEDVDFNRNFNSATLEPGPSQRELQHAEEATKAAAEKEKQKVESARVKDSWEKYVVVVISQPLLFS